jgi:acetyltransferase-like isoleucine patch superfamily enzyme
LEILLTPLLILIYVSQENLRQVSEKKVTSIGLIGRGLFIVIFIFVVYSLILIPPVALFVYVFPFFNLSSILNIIAFCFFLTFELLFFIVCQTLIPGFILKILRLKIREGEYDTRENNKELLKMIIITFFYHVPLTLLNVFKLIPLRMFLHRCAGAKIGKNCFIPDTTILYEPYLIEIGDNTLIGADCKISAHTIDDNKIIIKKVKIGKNCLIGGEVIVHPGAVIEDNVTVAIKSYVRKNQVLEKGKTYIGIPAKELIKRK